MSTETPERDTKSYYQVKREKLAAALIAWQDDPTGNDEANTNPLADADALEDFLRERGLQVLPTGYTSGWYRVLVDGKPVPYVGQDRLSGPVDGDMAAELFLVATLDAEKRGDGEAAIEVRPATNDERVRHAVMGDPVVMPDPVEITADGYMILFPDVDPDPDVRVIVFTTTDDGRPVRVRMDMGLLRELSQSTSDEVSEWDTANGGEDL